MRVLIVYGTTEGHTRKIANRVAERIRELGHEAQLHDSSTLLGKLPIGEFAGAIVAASVHHHVHQEALTGFVMAHRDQLNAKLAAFVSVSLSAALEPDHLEAQKYVDSFVAETGWQPNRTLLIPGALRNTSYDYFKQQIVRYIVMKGQGPVNTDRDHEFTDWTALSSFVDSFIEMVDVGHS